MHELPGLYIYKEYLKDIIAVAFSTVCILLCPLHDIGNVIKVKKGNALCVPKLF